MAEGLGRRILRHPLVQLPIGFVLVALTLGFGQYAMFRLVPRGAGWRQLGVAIVAAVALVLVWKAYKRWIERAPDAELAGPGAGREWLAGLALGCALFAVMAGIVALCGGLAIDGPGGFGDFPQMAALALISSTGEEILFRGVILRQLERLAGTWIALGLTAAFFGAAHLANPGATWFAALAIAIEAGILLGACYLLTRRLWLAIGTHAGWNFTQGWVFAAPVSGGKAEPGLLVTHLTGPTWLSGGAFGLEACVVAMLVALVAGVAVLVAAVGRGGIVPFGRKKR